MKIGHIPENGTPGRSFQSSSSRPDRLCLSFLLMFLLIPCSRAGWRGETSAIPDESQINRSYIGPKLGTISEPSRPPTRYPTLDDENITYDRTVLGYVWPLSDRWFLFAGAGLEISRHVWSDWRAPGRSEKEQIYNQLFPTIETGIGVMF